MSYQTQLLDGTAALPSLTFRSDPDTGMFRPGANQLSLVVSGVLKTNFTSAGVAIIAGGITLDNAQNFQFLDSGGASQNIVRVDAGDNLNLSGAAAGADIFFRPIMSGAITVTFKSNGRVGIGTVSPGGDLTLAAGKTLAINSGTNQRAGDAVLVAGTVTVANTSVSANTRVFLSRKTAGGTLGTSFTYTVIAGTSFTITASVVTDTSTVSYLLIEVP